jgi:hypothetical protein
MDPVMWLRKQLEDADVGLLRQMLGAFIQTVMSAEADALCGRPMSANYYNVTILFIGSRAISRAFR